MGLSLELLLVLQQRIIVDGHIDTPQRMLDMKADISARLPDAHVDGPRMKEEGLTAAFFSIWVDSRYGRGRRSRGRSRAWGSRGGTRSRVRSPSSIPCTGSGRAT